MMYKFEQFDLNKVFDISCSRIWIQLTFQTYKIFLIKKFVYFLFKSNKPHGLQFPFIQYELNQVKKYEKIGLGIFKPNQLCNIYFTSLKTNDDLFGLSQYQI